MVDMNQNISISGAWNSMFRNNSTGISLRDAIAEKIDNSLDQFKRLGKKNEDCKIQFGFTKQSPRIAYVFDNAGMQDRDLEKFLCIFKPGKKEDEGNLIGQHGVGGQIADYLLSNQGTNIVISKSDDLIQMYCVDFKKINEAANKADNNCMTYIIEKKFNSLDELFEFAKNDTKANPGDRARICEVEEFSRELFDENGNGTVFLYNDIQENGNNNITNLFKSLGNRSNHSSPDFDQKISNEDFLGHTYCDYINNKSVTINYIDSRGVSTILPVDPTYVSDLKSFKLEEDNVTNCGDKFKPLSNIFTVKVKVYEPFDKNNEGYIIETPKEELSKLEKETKNRFDQMDTALTYTKKRQGSIKNLPPYILYQKGLDRELTKPLNNDSEFDEKKFNKKDPHYLYVTFTHTEQLKDTTINYNEATCGITITRQGKSLEPHFPEQINKRSKLYEAGFGKFGYTGKLRANENTHFRMKISFNDTFCNRLFPSKINKSESGQSSAATCIADLLFRALRVLWPKKVKSTEKVDETFSETASETTSETASVTCSEIPDKVTRTNDSNPTADYKTDENKPVSVDMPPQVVATNEVDPLQNGTSGDRTLHSRCDPGYGDLMPKFKSCSDSQITSCSQLEIQHENTDKSTINSRNSDTPERIQVDEQPVDEQSVDEPSVDEPSVDEPSVDEQSVDEPSVDEPPEDEKQKLEDLFKRYEPWVNWMFIDKLKKDPKFCELIKGELYNQ